MFLVRFTTKGPSITVTTSDTGEEGSVLIRKLEDLTPLPTAELIALRNVLGPERPITKFSTRAIGIKSVWSYLQDLAKPAAPILTLAKATKTKATKAAPSGRIAGTMRIVKLVKDNPRREGTNGYKSWQVTRDGMSVEQYVAAGGRLDDLRWNVKHNWLKLDA